MKMETVNPDDNENFFTFTVFKIVYITKDENTGIEVHRIEYPIRVIHLIVIALIISTLIRVL